MKYTQGKWKVNPAYTMGVMVDRYRPLKHVDCGRSVGVRLSKEEAEANARLIAAAPDMYEALKAVMGYHGSPSIPDLIKTMMPETYENILAALSKAEGETK